MTIEKQTETYFKQLVASLRSIIENKNGIRILGNINADTSSLALDATLQSVLNNVQILSGIVNTNNEAKVNIQVGTNDVSNANPLPVNATITSAPTSFILDSVDTQVVEDTVTPSNNTPLPVKLTSTTGDINITAGDLNVQLTHAGASYDSVRVGDGTELMAVNASNEAQVRDDDANTTLSTIVGDTTSLDGKVTVCDTGSVDINDISKGTQTNDVKVTLDGESVTVVTEADTAPSKTRITNLNNSAQTVSSSASYLAGYIFINPNTYSVYIKLYNIASGSVTVGTSTVTSTISVPAQGEVLVPYGGVYLEEYNTAISVAVTKNLADNDNTAVSSNVHAEIYYKS